MKNPNMGKFVTRGHVEFTNTEALQIVDNLKAQFAKFEDYGIRFDNYEIVKDYSLPSLIVHFTCPHYKGRDSENGRLEVCDGIYFYLYKEIGHIELNWENNEYEPFDGFCYTGNIRFSARWCGYRRRHFECYQKIGPFAYGDELTDLNYEDSIGQFCRDLRNCKVVK